MSKYDDIIMLEHPEPDPTKHPRMSRRDRAAQFAPFAALTGFGDIISETSELQQFLQRNQSDENIDTSSCLVSDLIAGQWLLCQCSFRTGCVF